MAFDFMVQDIYYSQKHKVFFNICRSHSYEIMTEFYPKLGTLLTSMRSLAATVYGSREFVMSESSYKERLKSLEEELNDQFIEFGAFKAFPYKGNNWHNLEKAYNFLYKNFLEVKLENPRDYEFGQCKK